MERRRQRSYMGVSLMASLLIHAAAILFIPVALPGRTVVYPVQFGEIAQTFETPRQGLPEGTAVSGPVGKAQGTQAGALRTGSETSVGLRPATAPRAAGKPAQTPAPKPESKPAPQKQAAPAPSATKNASATASTGASASAPKAPEKATTTARATSATTPQSAQKGATQSPAAVASAPAKGPTSKGIEGVLTGRSDETVPATSQGAEPSGVAAAAPAPRETAGTAADAAGHAAPQPAVGMGENGGGGPDGSADSDEAAGPADQSGPLEAGAPGGPVAGPPRPRGAEFGTGEGLAVFAIPPVYPKGAENVWTEGRVAMTVTVDSQGNATNVAVVSSSGVAALDEAAVRTVSRAWRFKGIGWPYQLSVSVVFRRGSVELSYGGVAVLGE